jgi:tRNA pseudouridine13 synthase
LSPSHHAAALHPPRAHGAPLARGTLRADPEDFVVEEDLGFTASGAGQHVLLKVRKRNANTQWVARELAKLCGCHPRDIGYAGLKDRRAIAIQWFTVPKSKLSLEAWREIRHPEFDVLQADAHSRKLPRGALAGNRFTIRIRDLHAADTTALATRIAAITERGVPNYFGPQRFGRDGANLARITDDPRTLRPPERGFVLSAARSLIFNAVLAERVNDGTWERLESGDIANLDGRGSIFAVDATDPTLTDRCAKLDIHPTGPLWGRGAPATHGRIGELETRIASEFPAPSTLVANAGMDQERRPLRLAVRDLTYDYEPDVLTIRFRLTRGSFATTVLRELIDSDTLTESDGDDA